MQDLTLIIFIKLLVIFLGNYILVFWLKKRRTKIKVIICWFIGFFLNLVQPFTIYDGIFKNFFLNDNGVFNVRDYGSLASILAIITYIFMGNLLFRKNIYNKS
tara:strand:- start:204 stop:512 length:309 start_codon:yes stop_codon:yes gene_type:complete